jgi:hypothetical protein
MSLLTEQRFYINTINSPSGKGGAVFADEQTRLSVHGSNFDGNTARGIGGSLYVGAGAAAFVVSTSFRPWFGKFPSFAGGVLYADFGAVVHVVDSLFDRAWALNGGIIYGDNYAVITLLRSSFSNSFCSQERCRGGAISASLTNLIIDVSIQFPC